MTDKTGGFYTSGWCGSCGRRRAADGRCLNCDAWWTSPLVQIGGPVVVLGTLLLLVSLSFVRTFSGSRDGGDVAGGRSPAFTAPAASSAVLGSPGGVSPLSPYRPSAAFSAAPPPAPPMQMPIAASFAPSPPSAAELAWAAQRELVQNAGYVDYTIQRDDAARAAAARNSGASMGNVPRPSFSREAQPMDNATTALPDAAPTAL